MQEVKKCRGDNLAEGLVSVYEAARYLGVKPNTIRTWVMQRRIPFHRAGSRLRFKISSLANWSEPKPDSDIGHE